MVKGGRIVKVPIFIQFSFFSLKQVLTFIEHKDDLILCPCSLFLSKSAQICMLLNGANGGAILLMMSYNFIQWNFILRNC